LIPKEVFGIEGIVDNGFLSENIDAMLYADGHGMVWSNYPVTFIFL